MATTLGGEKEIEKIQDTIEEYLVNMIGLSIEDIVEKEDEFNKYGVPISRTNCNTVSVITSNAYEDEDITAVAFHVFPSISMQIWVTPIDVDYYYVELFDSQGSCLGSEFVKPHRLLGAVLMQKIERAITETRLDIVNEYMNI